MDQWNNVEIPLHLLLWFNIHWDHVWMQVCLCLMFAPSCYHIWCNLISFVQLMLISAPVSWSQWCILNCDWVPFVKWIFWYDSLNFHCFVHMFVLYRIGKGSRRGSSKKSIVENEWIELHKQKQTISMLSYYCLYLWIYPT